MMTKLFIWKQDDLSQLIIKINEDVLLFNYQNNKFNDFEILEDEEVEVEEWNLVSNDINQVQHFDKKNHFIIKYIMTGNIN